MKLGKAAKDKLLQLSFSAKEQLSEEEYQEFMELLDQLVSSGFTQWINARLGLLMAKLNWELEVEESPEWSLALQACDFAFLGRELKETCEEYGLSTRGHKKILCKRLYMHGVEAVVAKMEPFLEGVELTGITIHKSSSPQALLRTRGE